MHGSSEDHPVASFHLFGVYWVQRADRQIAPFASLVPFWGPPKRWLKRKDDLKKWRSALHCEGRRHRKLSTKKRYQRFLTRLDKSDQMCRKGVDYSRRTCMVYFFVCCFDFLALLSICWQEAWLTTLFQSEWYSSSALYVSFLDQILICFASRLEDCSHPVPGYEERAGQPWAEKTESTTLQHFQSSLGRVQQTFFRLLCPIYTQKSLQLQWFELICECCC